MALRTFGSHHQGGWHFVMVDGSVQFIHQSISLAAYQSLGHRPGGLPGRRLGVGHHPPGEPVKDALA